jgi:hypothetical protein
VGTMRGGFDPCEFPLWHRKGGSQYRMPLDLYSLNCAARIVGGIPTRAGVVRDTIGTGFFLSVQSETSPDTTLYYLVTAHHVINGPSAEPIDVHAAHPRSGVFGPSMRITNWMHPIPDLDLVFAPVEPTSFMKISWEESVIPDRAPCREQELFPGSLFHYIGMFAPANRVMARSGTFGALDIDKRPWKDPDTGRIYHYPAHLVDCRSYGGFSGSPCFVELSYASLQAIEETPRGLPEEHGPFSYLHHTSFLCGMFTMHWDDENEAARSHYGVGVMLRSEEIREALMHEKMRKDRAERGAEDKAARDKDRVEPKPARRDGSDDEFGRFEDLTDKLLKVPKKELDKKRKQKS